MQVASPTQYANNLLHKALEFELDEILDLVAMVARPMIDADEWTVKDMKRLQANVIKAVQVRDTVAVMLAHSEVLDPRQLTMFGDISPNDFQKT